MRRKIAICAALTLFATVILSQKADAPTMEQKTAARRGSAKPRRAGPSHPESPGQRNYRFSRSIEVKLKNHELANFQASGKLLVFLRNSALKTAVVTIEKLESPGSPPRKLPAVHLEWGDRDSLQISAATPDGDDAQIAARFAVDLIDQYRFFSKSDLQGAYEARFQRTGASGFRKMKVKYTSGPYLQARIESSKHLLSQDESGFAFSIKGHERMVLGQGDFALESKSDYRIEVKEGSSHSAGLSSLTWHSIQMKSLETLAASRDDKIFLESTPSLASLLAALRAGTLNTGAKQNKWFRDMVRRMNHETGGFEPVRAAFDELHEQAEPYRLLVGALASTTNKNASDLLLDKYKDAVYTHEQHAMILTAWIGADTPLSKATVEHLMNSSEPGALLALGAQAAKTADGRNQIVSLLLDKLKAARTEEEIIAALDAIGNTGLPDFLTAISEHLRSASDRVRAHAFLALRSIPGSEVAALLKSGQSDRSVEVQSSVVVALNQRPEQSAER